MVVRDRAGDAGLGGVDWKDVHIDYTSGHEDTVAVRVIQDDLKERRLVDRERREIVL